MKVLGWVKAVVAVVLGLAIGLAVTGIVNILHPGEPRVGARHRAGRFGALRTGRVPGDESEKKSAGPRCGEAAGSREKKP